MRCDEVVPFQQLDVQVAHRSRDGLDPPQLGAMALECGGREDAPQLPQDRPRASQRDAELVQELGVDVVEGAGQVRLGHVGERVEQPEGSLVRAHARLEVDLDLALDAARISAQHADGGVGHRAVHGREAQLGGDHPSRPVELLVVAEHPPHMQLRPQRLRAAFAAGLRRLQLEPHGRLLIGVEDVQVTDTGADARERQQRAHLDDRLEPVAQRPVGQVLDEVARAALGDARERRRPRLGEHQRTSLPRELHTGPSQPAVGRVEDDPVRGRRPVLGQVEPLGESSRSGRRRRSPAAARRRPLLARRDPIAGRTPRAVPRRRRPARRAAARPPSPRAASRRR